MEVRRLLAEEREPRADAAVGVVEDTVLSTARSRQRVVPEAARALADEAGSLLGAERAHPGERHPDAVAAPLAELALEARPLARSKMRDALPIQQTSPAGPALWHQAYLALRHVDPARGPSQHRQKPENQQRG